jgi:hypothetical protein
MKRWALGPRETVSRSWSVYKVKKFSQIREWDHESTMELLELCSKTELYTDLYYEIDRDLSTWGVNQDACKRLANYISKFF